LASFGGHMSFSSSLSCLVTYIYLTVSFSCCCICISWHFRYVFGKMKFLFSFYLHFRPGSDLISLVVLSPVHTVAEKCDCHRKRRENGDSRRIRRQSHFSATVAVFCDRRRFRRQIVAEIGDYSRQCGQALICTSWPSSCSCWGDLFKKPKAPSFQIGSGWNLAGLFASIDGLRFSIRRRNLKITTMMQLTQKKCWHLVRENEASAARLCNSIYAGSWPIVHLWTLFACNCCYHALMWLWWFHELFAHDPISLPGSRQMPNMRFMSYDRPSIETYVTRDGLIYRNNPDISAIRILSISHCTGAFFIPFFDYVVSWSVVDKWNVGYLFVNFPYFLYAVVVLLCGVS